jgi:hypothetical protein
MTLNIKLLEHKMLIMKLDDTISNLKTMLPAADFIVTGSFVLAKYGLFDWSKVADLDIILVKPETSAIVVLNRYMKEHPAPTTARLKTTVLPFPNDESQRDGNKVYKVEAAKKPLQAIFLLDRVKIDVFIENDFNEPTLLVDGIKYATVPHIVKAKHMYGRMKDWLQCRDMAALFYKEDEFQAAINKDWQSMLRSDY